MLGLFPPSSKVTFFRLLLPEACWIRWPTWQTGGKAELYSTLLLMMWALKFTRRVDQNIRCQFCRKKMTQHFSRFLIKMQNFSLHIGCLFTHSDPCSSGIISKGDFFWLSCVTLTSESFKNKKRHLTLFSFLLLDSTNLTKTCIHSTDPGLCT